MVVPFRREPSAWSCCEHERRGCSVPRWGSPSAERYCFSFWFLLFAFGEKEEPAALPLPATTDETPRRMTHRVRPNMRKDSSPYSPPPPGGSRKNAEGHSHIGSSIGSSSPPRLRTCSHLGKALSSAFILRLGGRPACHHGAPGSIVRLGARASRHFVWASGPRCSQAQRDLLRDFVSMGEVVVRHRDFVSMAVQGRRPPH